MDDNLSYLERKRQKQATAPASELPGKSTGAAAAFRPKAKVKVVTEVTTKPRKTEQERPQIVQNVPQTRKLLAAAIFELDELMANR
ncbi:MAG: hypothetical protein ACKVHO_06790 [Verrucomicrobiia bacterium]|jgi:hypothetical protein